MVEAGALEEVRVELIEGLLCDVSSPSPEHDAVIVYLNASPRALTALTRRCLSFVTR